MSALLEGKVVVITGGSRGIGRACADACAAGGATVVLASRDAEAVARAVAELRAQGAKASGVPCDVSSADALDALLAHVVERWGGAGVWMNNAGVTAPYRPLAEIAPADLKRVAEVNLVGTMLASRVAVRHFLERGRGVLVNMSGRGGRGDAVPMMAPYAATKAGVVSLTRSLAAEVGGTGVSVHAFLPGMVDTGLISAGLPGDCPEDVRRGTRLALEAFGVPLAEVGRRFAEIAAQEPGRETGKVYSALRASRVMRGAALMTWWRATGKLGNVRG